MVSKESRKAFEETKRKISKTMRGRKLSEEHIKNVSIALTGKKISKEAIAKRVAKVFGVNHPKWKGGISVGKNRKEYFRIKCLERVARKHNAKGFFTLEEWRILKNKYKNTCLSCGKKEPKIRLTIDHMKPLIKGGSNYIRNIQPLCVSCNCKKNSKIINYRKLYEKSSYFSSSPNLE